MADRKVRLIIEVDDKDVKATEASLSRLGVATKRVGDSGSADMDRFTGSMTKAHIAGNLISGMISRLPEIALRGSKAVFDLAVNFGEYGLRIEKARQLTGMKVEMLSALESQTHRTGTQFDQLGEGIKLFTKLIGDANNGSDSAVAKMKRLGLEPVKAAQDLEVAFREVLKRIVALPTEVEQANAAMDAFGEQGFKLLPFFKSFNGDVDELIKKAREMGVVMGEDDVRAAMEFDNALKDVQDRARAVGITFGKELADPIKQSLDDINGWLQNNKNSVASWAKWVADKVAEMSLAVQKELNDIAAIGDIIDGIFAGENGQQISERLKRRTLESNRISIAQSRIGKINASPFSGGETPDYTPHPEWFQGPYFTGDKPAKAKKAAGGGSDEMRRFFEEQGFVVSRTVGGALNKGSLHPMGRAADVSIRGKSIAEITNLVANAIEHGYRLFDERVKRPGVFQSGPHLHFERNQNKASGFLGQGMYSVPLDYLRSLDKKRLGKGTISTDEVGQFLDKQSEMLTEAERTEHLRRIIKVYKMTGVIPSGKMLDDIHKLMVDDVKQTGVSTFGMTPGTTAAGFGRGVLDTTTGLAGGGIQSRALQLSVQDQYIKNLRISLGLETETTDELSRGAMLLGRKAVKEKEIEALLEDQRVTRGEITHDLEIQLELLQRGNIEEEANTRALEDKVFISREIRDLQIELMNLGRNDQLVREADNLRDILEVERARLDLSRAMEISNNKIRAGIYEHMNAQKTLNEGIIDGINGTYDAILRRMNEPLDKLNDKSKGLLSFITEPLKAMQAQGLNNIFTGIVDKLFPGMGSQMEKAKNPVVGELKDHTRLLEQIARNTGGLPAGYSGGTGGGIGGTIGNILGSFGIGGFGGGRTGVGGTPPFFPGNNFGGAAAGGGDMSGTISGSVSGGRWGGLFDPQKNPFTGKMNSELAGTMGGIGSIASMAGGMIGGKWGNMVSLAGTGMSMGAMFGPWGAAIGAAAGAGIGLFMALRGDGAEKKLKEAASSQFGINVKDKSVLGALKNLGEGMFGKGKVGANAIAVVRSEEGMNILKAYAEGSGQSSLKIDRLNYGDPNWEGNNFRSGGAGIGLGSGFGGGAGISSSSVNGTIMPARPSVSTSSGIDRTLVASLAESVYQLADEVRSFKTMPAGALVKAGLDENPAAAADAVEREYGNDGRRAEKQFRNLGQMV